MKLQAIQALENLEIYETGRALWTLQEKFLLMDSSSLASWLEKMLLGYTAQSAVGNLPIGVSNSVRDSTIAFINALVSPSSDSKSRELCDHILDAFHHIQSQTTRTASNY